MALYQNMNQFAQSPLKGDLAKIVNPSTISAQVDIGAASALVAGTMVKLTTSTGHTILVDTAAATTQNPLGFVIYSPKKDSWTGGDALEIAMNGSVIYLEAAEAISRGRSLEYVASGAKVRASRGSNPVIGIALDNATATGGLIRVLVDIETYPSQSSSSSSRSSSSSSSSS